jgi:hypothetical protein
MASVKWLTHIHAVRELASKEGKKGRNRSCNLSKKKARRRFVCRRASNSAAPKMIQNFMTMFA